MADMFLFDSNRENYRESVFEENPWEKIKWQSES